MLTVSATTRNSSPTSTVTTRRQPLTGIWFRTGISTPPAIVRRIALLLIAILFSSLATATLASTTDPGTDRAPIYYLNDVLGSPHAVSDHNGNVLWVQHRRPFGDIQPKIMHNGEVLTPPTDALGLPQTHSDDTSRDYTFHVRDSATGLVYMKARYYDPVSGRFYSNDPVGFSTATNTGVGPSQAIEFLNIPLFYRPNIAVTGSDTFTVELLAWNESHITITFSDVIRVLDNDANSISDFCKISESEFLKAALNRLYDGSPPNEPPMFTFNS